jgi:hypothetical protein
MMCCVLLAGVYGHSSVYNQQSRTIYVYGGYLFRAGRWYISRELYTLDLEGGRKWNLLMVQTPEFPPKESLHVSLSPLPCLLFFFSQVYRRVLVKLCFESHVLGYFRGILKVFLFGFSF